MADNAPKREPLPGSSFDNELDKAIEKQGEALERHGEGLAKEGDKQGPSEAGQHAKRITDDEDKKNALKVVGGIIAIIAAITLGAKAISKKGNRREEAEQKGRHVQEGTGKSLRNTQRWLGEKAETAKDKAGEITDDVAPRIKGAAGATKDKLGNVVPSSVSNTAASVKDRANITGIKAEREGLKASEKSDATVRDAADKLITTSGRAADKVDHKSGGFFSNVGSWLSDRKDDAADATGTVAHKVEKTVKGKNRA